MVIGDEGNFFSDKHVLHLDKDLGYLGVYTCQSLGNGHNTDVVEKRATRTPMFIAAMSTIAKLWEELRCSSTDEWKKKICFIYTTEYYAAT